MGSVFPHFEGTKWWRLGYDSYDFNKCYSFLNMRRFRVHKGRLHTIAVASNIADAKRLARERRGWKEHEIDSVHIVHH